MFSRSLTLFSISFTILTFFDHIDLFARVAAQSSADVFVLPDTGDIYSIYDYEDIAKNDWTDILYKEKKVDRQDYIEYEENLKRMNKIYSLLSTYSGNDKIPINFLTPDEYSNPELEEMEQYIQYNLNNNENDEGSIANIPFLPLNTHGAEMEQGFLNYNSLREFFAEEKPDYDFENQKNGYPKPNIPLRKQLNSNGRMGEEHKQSEISKNNINTPKYFEANSQSSINQKDINTPGSFNPDTTSHLPNIGKSKHPSHQNGPEISLNSDDYNDDLSLDEAELLDKIMAQKDVQEALLQKGSFSDASLKSILNSMYSSTNNENIHSSDENKVDFERAVEVSIPTDDPNLTLQENLSSKTTVNYSIIPKKEDIFETDNQDFQVSLVDGLNSKGEGDLEEEIQLFNGFDSKNAQKENDNEAVKSKGSFSKIEYVPIKSIHSIRPLYPSDAREKDELWMQNTIPSLSINEVQTISRSIDTVFHLASPSSEATMSPKITNMKNTSFSGSNDPELSYPTESLSILNSELEYSRNNIVESSVLQTGNLQNDTLELNTIQSGADKAFDPNFQIKNPNGSWSPSCKSVHKGMYCMELDGEGSTVVECFGENIGFQFSCGNGLFCYAVNAYDVDCRARV